MWRLWHYLHRRLYRQKRYWAEMAKEATELQSACPQCQEPKDVGESLFRSDSRRLETNLSGFLSAPCIVKQNRYKCDENQKEILKILCGRTSYVYKRFQLGTFRCITSDKVFMQATVTKTKGALCSTNKPFTWAITGPP